MRRACTWCAVAICLTFTACHPGGTYAGAGGAFGDADRGETNGRMFDFVSNKPDGDDWQIRIRGNSLWVSYSKDQKSDTLGTKGISDKETNKIWKLIDNLELDNREKGKKDEDQGYLTLRLREPTDKQHDIYTVYVTRATQDDDVVDLATYLQDLVAKYFKEKPNF